MTSSDDKTVWLTGNETIMLVTDLLRDNTNRLRSNAMEMLAIQIVYTAYKNPNQWIAVSEEFVSAKLMKKCEKLFEALGYQRDRGLQMEILQHTRMFRVMVQSYDPADRRMSGYERIITPSPIIF